VQVHMNTRTVKVSAYIALVLPVLLASSLSAQNLRPIEGCGERCVKLLCRFYGREIKEDTVRTLLAANEQGACSLKDIERCLSQIGLGCYGFIGTPEDLSRIKYPVVLHVRKSPDDKIGHFAVCLWSTRENKLFGYDPSVSGAPFPLTHQRLKQFWSGAGVIVCPSPQSLHSAWLYLLPIVIGAMLLGGMIAWIKNSRW
jgi:ABC-type bacteriocin/lantibiotic exporter with double-glycine peptidase domain